MKPQKKRRLHVSHIRTILELKEKGYDEETYIIGSRALAQKLNISEITVMLWRNKGIISGELLAVNVWRYNLADVIKDLEKLK